MDYNFIYNELKGKNVEDLTTSQIAEMKSFILGITDQITNYQSFNQILQRQLNDVADDRDKRTGSIIYDALAPSSGEMAQNYIEIAIYTEQTYLLTATGENLDRKGAEYGVTREVATQAKRLGKLVDTNNNLVNIPINSRFTVPKSNNTITYYISEYQSTGIPVFICEQTGTQGNEYIGELLPLFSISNLKTAEISGILTPAQDKEDDDSYRQRIITRLNQKGFGGNIQDYKDYFTENITGTSEPKVYPIWNGGGTVKVSVLDSEYNPISDGFKELIKETLDPEEYTGQGVGIAPIGHKVTVDTPQKSEVNIEADVTLEGVTVGQIITSVKDSLENYFYETRSTWVDYETIRIFVAQVIARILETQGIQNVTNVKLNDQSNDLAFTSTAEVQYVPVLGEVTLNEQE